MNHINLIRLVLLKRPGFQSQKYGMPIYVYKFTAQMWKMWIILMFFQYYFALFEQNSIRIIQNVYNFSCKSYFMCKLRR